jgi:hypothetical protein
MHLYTECKAIVLEAIEQVGHDDYAVLEFSQESCEGHEVAIYCGKAFEFCATQDTNDGEQYLEDCGGIVQEGDTFGSVACRIAFATLFVTCERIYNEILEEMEE